MKVIVPCACLALAAFVAAAAAQDITITSAAIRAGKLLITGTTATGGMKVRLDGQTGAAYNVTSNVRTKAFTFDLAYLPSDCIVSLQKLTPPSTLGSAANGVVADCGARGLSPRGAWVSTQTYLTDDLVTSGGSSWRAKRSNINKPPATGASDWENFASKGTPGATGPAGPQGPAGTAGTTGAAGPTGPQGPAGSAGPSGAAGPTGPQGPAGGTGPTGPQGPAGVTPHGAWSASTAYAENDLVLFGSSTWRALRANTNKSPDVSSLDWQAFAQKGDQGAPGLAGPTGPVGPQGPAGPAGSGGPAGSAGAAGPSGPTGPQGQQGAVGPTGIVETAGFAGLGNPVPGSSAAFVFVEPTGTVTTTGALQRLTASASVPATAPAAVPVDFALCYAAQPSGPMFLFAGSGHHQTANVGVSPSMTMLATSATSVLGTPGSYKVGLCFRNQSAQTITLGQVTGFVQATN